MAEEEKEIMLKETTIGNQTKKPEFPYFYGNEADSYSFFIVPRILFKAKTFMNVSAEAKLLYSMLVDRMKLSAANDWRDEEGRVYIYFPRSTVMNQLGCGAQKATRLMEELDDRRGVGLITRVRQGLGKPDRIYVRKCILPEMELRDHSSEYGEMRSTVDPRMKRTTGLTRGRMRQARLTWTCLSLQCLL